MSQVRLHQRPSRYRTEQTWRHGVSWLRLDVFQQRKSAVAGTQGCHQETEIREDQWEENVNTCWSSLQGFPRRVCHVFELLPRSSIRRGSRLHVSPSAVQDPLPNPQPPVRLHFRLDDVETEGRSLRCRRRNLRLRSSSHHARTSLMRIKAEISYMQTTYDYGLKFFSNSNLVNLHFKKIKLKIVMALSGNCLVHLKILWNFYVSWRKKIVKKRKEK